MKRKTFYTLILKCILLFSILNLNELSVRANEPIITIVAKFPISENPPYPTDYNEISFQMFFMLRQQLAKLGINVDIINLTSSAYYADLFGTRDFDVVYLPIAGGGTDPDFSEVYGENGSINLSGYDTSMDWNVSLGSGTNQWYLDYGKTMTPLDSSERVTHYKNWQQYIMDKILPIVPYIGYEWFTITWSNLNDYDMNSHLLQSIGKLSWDGLHGNQTSINELRITEKGWSDSIWDETAILNPLLSEHYDTIPTLCYATMDPLIWRDKDNSYWPHLATNWTMINDTHMRISLREDVNWQTDPDGLFTNEIFDARDVYFTLYSWKNLAYDKLAYQWIKDIQIIDDYTIDIYIDGNPETTYINEPYRDYLLLLNQLILPEFYLNQSQLADGKTPDTSHPGWAVFAHNCFGTGLFTNITTYESNNSITYDETELVKFNNCWRLNPDLANDSNLNWIQRFGDKWIIDKLTLKDILPLDLILQEFLNGNIDIARIKLSEYLENFQLDSRFNLYSSYLDFLGGFCFNMRESRTWLGSREPCPYDPSLSIGLAIRKAIAYAINRVELINIIYDGLRPLVDWPIYPSLGKWLNLDIIKYDFDLDLAREFLAKTGLLDQTKKFAGFGFIITLSIILGTSITSIGIRNLSRKKMLKQ